MAEDKKKASKQDKKKASKQDKKAKKDKLATTAKAEFKAEAEIKAKATAEAEQEVKADQAEKKNKRERDEELASRELIEQAQTLGITPSRVSVAGSRVKDKTEEAKKHKKFVSKRLKNRIRKKKDEAGLDAAEKRKRLLTARLKTPGTRCTPEQRRQYAAELHAIKIGVWFEPTRDEEGKLHCWKVPKKMTAYDRFMAST